MSLMGFEPTIPVFKRAKTFHALDRAAIVTGVDAIEPELMVASLNELPTNK
jgi:hypothetical protein